MNRTVEFKVRIKIKTKLSSVDIIRYKTFSIELNKIRKEYLILANLIEKTLKEEKRTKGLNLDYGYAIRIDNLLIKEEGNEKNSN